jgi:hypothetical protein
VVCEYWKKCAAKVAKENAIPAIGAANCKRWKPRISPFPEEKAKSVLNFSDY